MKVGSTLSLKHAPRISLERGLFINVQGKLALEPETILSVRRMDSKPTNTLIKRYDSLIKEVKIGQGLSLGSLNLTDKFQRFYINCSHDHQASKVDWCGIFDKNEVGNVLFTPMAGVKSNGTSYNQISVSTGGTNNRRYIGCYLIENVNTGAGLGARDNLDRGIYIILNATNQSAFKRELLLSSATRAGLTRHVTAVCNSNSTNATGDLWVNGVYQMTSAASGTGTFNTVSVELGVFDTVVSALELPCQGLIAFSYVSQMTSSITIDVLALHNSLQEFLDGMSIKL